jgi:hypothetical protein
METWMENIGNIGARTGSRNHGNIGNIGMGMETKWRQK